MQKLRLPVTHPATLPPAGFVDVYFDKDSQSLVIKNPDGTTSEVSTAAPAPGNTAPAEDTAVPPYVRVANGYIYVQQDGVWMQAALEALGEPG